MKPGQKIFNLLKQANRQHVPLSHLVAVTKFERSRVVDLCERLVSIGKVECRYLRNGQEYEMHYWVEQKDKRR